MSKYCGYSIFWKDQLHMSSVECLNVNVNFVKSFVQFVWFYSIFWKDWIECICYNLHFAFIYFSRRFVKVLHMFWKRKIVLNKIKIIRTRRTTYLRNHYNNFPAKAMYRIVLELLVSERKQIITFVITINLAQTGLWEI